jgi:PKD repeat protein
MGAMTFTQKQLVAFSARRPRIARHVGARALLLIGVLAGGALAVGPAPGTARAQTGVVMAAPILVAAPEDFSSDSTPTWTFTGDAGASFSCTLSQPFEGMWDGGPSGEEPEPAPVLIDSGSCDSGSYSFDLGAYPDHGYTFSVTQTDASGNTSDAASDGFRLDRVAYTPIIRTTPDDVTNDPTPTWTYYIWGELGTDVHCTLTRGEAATLVYDAGCGWERFTFDLSQYPDDSYTLSVRHTDPAGNASDAATDSFVLDRSIPNAAPVASFSLASCTELVCRFDAGASADSDGRIVSYGWDFGDGTFLLQSASLSEAWHSYNGPGTYTVTLTVTDNAEATSTASRSFSVGKPPPPPNPPPAAAFAVSCIGLSCSVDAGASTDDGTITGYVWEFGDSSTGTAKHAQHTCATSASYTIKLTVTDDDGAKDTASRPVTPITGLTAQGYKLKAQQKVDLGWNGSFGTSYDVHRDGLKIAAVSSSSYTDNLNRKGSGSYSYTVCQTGSAICSNQATATF